MSNEWANPMENLQEVKEPNANGMEKANPNEAAKPNIDDAWKYRATYPELYYKLRPHIDMACDLVGTYGSVMPTRKQLEQLSDGIFEDFCKLYPEMSGYMHRDDPQDDPPPFRGGFRPGFGFRRRGLGRDLIDTLLLAGLLGRGYYYY